VWSKAHDILFCRDLLLSEPFTYKVRNNERKKAWESITDNLHCIQEHKFKVSLRSVRDRYTYLTTKKSAQLKEEFKASGIEVVETELDILLEEILDKEKEAKLALDDKKKQEQEKEEKDKFSAHDIRKKAMERMSQSTKRKDDDDDDDDGSTGVPKKQKTRRSSQELFQFLEEKVSKDYTYKQEKLEAKLKEQEASDKREKERNDRLDKAMQQQSDTMMAMVTQQQKQQQQLQAMFMAQQQQQTQVLMAILERGGNINK